MERPSRGMTDEGQLRVRGKEVPLMARPERVLG